MIFAILFILAFLVGLVVYLLTGKWLAAVMLSMVIFLLSTLSDSAAQDSWLFTIVFGLPIVFIASLLGAYVVAIRRPEDEDASHDGGSLSSEFSEGSELDNGALDDDASRTSYTNGRH